MIDEELERLFRHIDEVNENDEKIFHNNDLPEQERTGFDDEKVQEIINKINNRVKEKKLTREEGREDRKKIRRVKELLERKRLYFEREKNSRRKKQLFQNRYRCSCHDDERQTDNQTCI